MEFVKRNHVRDFLFLSRFLLFMPLKQILQTWGYMCQPHRFSFIALDWSRSRSWYPKSRNRENKVLKINDQFKSAAWGPPAMLNWFVKLKINLEIHVTQQYRRKIYSNIYDTSIISYCFEPFLIDACEFRRFFRRLELGNQLVHVFKNFVVTFDFWLDRMNRFCRIFTYHGAIISKTLSKLLQYSISLLNRCVER